MHATYTVIALSIVDSVPTYADPLKLVVPPIAKSVEPQMIYFYKLLDLALSKTIAVDGPYSIEYYPESMSVERSLAELKTGHTINLVWLTTNARRERDFLPVRISLLRELNNYRVLLIRQSDQPLFDQIKTLDDLRRLRVGLGSQWPDTEIMRNNDFEVVTSLHYDSLFKMLAAKRFDFFPRGLYEVWDELEPHQKQGLVLEKNLMLYYENPFYFFVNKNNKALANRLERGLRLAMADGSFEQLFMSVPGYKRGTEEQLHSQRRLLRLTSQAHPAP